MASGVIYGSFTGASTSHVRPAIEWSSTPDTAKNESEVTAILVFYRYNTSFQSYNHDGKSMTLNIGGNSATQVRTFDIRGKSREVVWSRTVTIKHNSDGKKSITISASGDTGTSLGSFNFSGTAILDNIPRYAEFESFTVTDIRCTQFKVNYKIKDNRTISDIQYQWNGNRWYKLPSDGIIRNIKPGTTNTIRLSAKDSESGLWSYSDTLTVTQVALPEITSNVNFTFNESSTSDLIVDFTQPHPSIRNHVYLEAYYDGKWNRVTLTYNHDDWNWNRETRAWLNVSVSYLQNTLYPKFPNTDKIPIRVRLDAVWGYNGELQGTVYKYGEAIMGKSAYPSIDNIVCTVYGNGHDKTINKFVQNISRANVKFSTAAPFGANFKSMAIKVEGKTYTSNKADITTDILTGHGNIPITVSVTDTRGRTKETTTNIYVEEYSTPEILDFAVNRVEGTTDVEIYIKANFTNLNEKNRGRLNVQAQPFGGDWIHVVPYTNYSQPIDTLLLVHNIDDTKSYNFWVEVRDEFGYRDTAQLTIGTAKISFSIGRDEGIGAGKVWERGALDIQGDVFWNSLQLADIIIETGSNSNGDYIKLGNGMMICRGETTVTAQINIAWGSVYYYTIGRLTFPHAFAEIPHVIPLSLSDRSMIPDTYGVRQTNTGVISIYRPVADNQEYVYRVGYIAIGRWK